MNSDPSRIEADPTPPPAPYRFLESMLGRRRRLGMDPRYQLRVACTAEEAEFLESLADRVEAAKGEDEAASIGAELRDQAARKHLRLER